MAEKPANTPWLADGGSLAVAAARFLDAGQYLCGTCLDLVKIIDGGQFALAVLAGPRQHGLRGHVGLLRRAPFGIITGQDIGHAACLGKIFEIGADGDFFLNQSTTALVRREISSVSGPYQMWVQCRSVEIFLNFHGALGKWIAR